MKTQYAKIKRAAEASPATRRDSGVNGYQLDFVTPGMNPLDASSRKAMRESLKRPMKARFRPLAMQRRLRRTGLASRGN